jgi:hypothetical protein
MVQHLCIYQQSLGTRGAAPHAGKSMPNRYIPIKRVMVTVRLT